METDKKSYLEKLLLDENFYLKMAEKEGEVWGRIHSNKQLNDLKRKAQDATASLNFKIGNPIGLKK